MESRADVNQSNDAITSTPDETPDRTHIRTREPSLASRRRNSSDQEKPYTVDEDSITASSRQNIHGTPENDETLANDDPYALRGFKRDGKGTEATQQTPQGNQKIKRYYNRQNALIDAYLGSSDEEALEIEDTLANGPKVKFAVNASFICNFFLFVIQMYAAVSTGSLALFATAADAFMDLVSSLVMLVTSRLAAKPNIRKYPVGRKRVETVGIILFCALMTTVSVQLIIESGRSLGSGPSDSEELHIIPIAFVSTAIFSKGCLFFYCFFLRRYPAARIFMIDHRNDIAVNIFGLTMSIVGSRYNVVWYLDPVGAICIALLILYSWASNAFEHMWYLVGKSAPQDFLNKLVYVSVTHSSKIQKIETARAYHAGNKYYVEVDIVMDKDEPLKVTHDVSETLQRKLEGLSNVERAFVHVDYDDEHNVSGEHKPLYEKLEPKPPLAKRIQQRFNRSKSRAASGPEGPQ